jgi:hypothetical protein
VATGIDRCPNASGGTASQHDPSEPYVREVIYMTGVKVLTTAVISYDRGFTGRFAARGAAEPGFLEIRGRKGDRAGYASRSPVDADSKSAARATRGPGPLLELPEG